MKWAGASMCVPEWALSSSLDRSQIPLSAIVRRCVDRHLADTQPSLGERYARAMGLVGRFRDPDRATDLSRRHDTYLDR